MKKLLSAALAALCLIWALPAAAQLPIGYQDQVSNRTVVKPVTPANPLPVTGSISATTSATAVSLCSNAVAGGTGKPIAIDLFSALCVINVDPSTHQPLDPNASLPAGTNVIGHVIADTGSTTAVTGNVASTVADGANVALGSKADAATCATTNTALACFRQLHADITGSVPAGTAIIGKVGIDQTTDGTTNGVHLVAGTALAGKVGIDQTTVGTSNGVSVAQIGATTVVNGGLAGTLGVGGAAAVNAAPTTNPVLVSCEFKTNTTAATTGQQQFQACGDGFGNQGKSFTPAMATQITAQSATTANTANTATLAGTASKTTYISGFTCSAGGATAGQLVAVTVAGTITGSMTYTMGIPTGVAVAATPLVVSFPNPVAASAANTAITVQIAAAGSGNTIEQCNAQGFQQ